MPSERGRVRGARGTRTVRVVSGLCKSGGGAVRSDAAGVRSAGGNTCPRAPNSHNWHAQCIQLCMANSKVQSPHMSVRGRRTRAPRLRVSVGPRAGNQRGRGAGGVRALVSARRTPRLGCTALHYAALRCNAARHTTLC